MNKKCSTRSNRAVKGKFIIAGEAFPRRKLVCIEDQEKKKHSDDELKKFSVNQRRDYLW